MTARGLKQRAMGWVAVPAGIALVTAGVLVGRTSVRPTPAGAAGEPARPAASADDPRFSALEQDVRRLRLEVAAASRQAPPEQPLQKEQRRVEREPAADEPLDPAEAEEAAEVALGEFFDGLADRLDTEPADADFRSQTEPMISRLLRQHLGPDVQVSDVACGSSMCRAAVAHPRSARLSEDRLADFMLQRGALGKMAVQLDLREEGVTTLFFTRADG